VKQSTPRARAGGSASRAARKKTLNRRRANFKLLARLFCLSAGLGLAVSYAVQAPALVVKEIRVSGIHYADRAAVHSAAKTALGGNILLLRKGHVATAIERVSEVESVTIRRSLPCSVQVELTERRPHASLVWNGSYYLLQSDGLAFHAMKSPAVGLPVIKVAQCAQAKVGKACSGSGVRSALTIVKLARERRLNVAKISVDRLGDICLNMGSGFYVKLGQPEEMARKMTLLQKALAYKPSLARDAAYIDLSCPTACVWKPKVGAAS